MSCTNCYNGCAEIVSDQCVRYTGVDVPLLGIHNGDTLLTVENAIISFVTPFLDGSGIKPIIDPDIICDVVRQYIPTCVECNGFNLNDVLSAIIKATCNLQEQIDAIVAELAVLNAPYDSDCLVLSPNADTHTIVQAVINKLCEVEADLAILALDVSTNYIRIDQINNYIAAYLNASASDLVNAKMIPFVALEFYGDLIGKFDASGAGIGAWKDINLCNGNNNTPDKRGRVAVCAITDMGGGTLDPEVDPAVNPLFNPNYVIDDNSHGVNFITLNVTQIPSHTHSTSVTINDPGHKHDILGITGGDNSDNSNTVRFAGGDKNQTEPGFFFTNTEACQNKVTGLKGTGTGQNVFVSNSNIGGNLPHSNIQPVYPCYYIMYIPT